MPIYDVAINGNDNDKIELESGTGRVYLTSSSPTTTTTTLPPTTTTTTTSVIMSTDIPTNITSTTAVLGGVIENGSGIIIEDYGITVNEQINPTRAETRTFAYPTNWSTMPTAFPYSFSLNVQNFPSNTTFYVRAWVYDSTTVYYGEERTFTTN